MFNNIGGKIKTVAATVAWIGIILSCLGGFILIVQGLEYDETFVLYGLLAGGLGSLFSWLGSLTLYGLGQLIENSDELVRQGQHRQGSTPSAPSAPSAPNYGAPTNNYAAPSFCSRCGSAKNDGICPVCHKDQLDSLARGLRDGFITQTEYQQRLDELRRA